MQLRSEEVIRNADPTGPIEIADGVWWVGHRLEGDPFQCHAYLNEAGDQSVLFDPGSRLTIRHTLAKVQQVVPLNHIRWYICHHQDPDITGALPLLEELHDREDARIVTHWRAEALLKHLGLRTKFWRVEDNDWTLDLGTRRLRFVFTPYMHFPGAFTTFDEATGILFSSDIFGGFTDEWSLIAEDESYFEALRPFHEHYMPSRDVLLHGLGELRKLPIQLIAPQHGSMIPGRLVTYMIDRLSQLDCGLYLIAKGNTDVQRLSQINQKLRSVLRSMVTYRDFSDVAHALLELTATLLPATSLDFWMHREDERPMHLGPSTRWRAVPADPPDWMTPLCAVDREAFEATAGAPFLLREADETESGYPELVMPLYHPETRVVDGLAIVAMSSVPRIDDEFVAMMDDIWLPLEVALERERIHRSLELERHRIYEQSIRDTLTGLYTRIYMRDQVYRFSAIHDRDDRAVVGLAVFDIDHFKRINDTWGHLSGDRVLARVAAVIGQNVRAADLPVRFGGEEFAVFVSGASAEMMTGLAERVRREVSELTFDAELVDLEVTISCGVTLRARGEDDETFFARADAALYSAKEAGRNRVMTAAAPAAGAAPRDDGDATA